MASAACKPVMSMKKRLWNMLRIAVFMAVRGLLKQRRLLSDFQVMMKKGKTFGKSLVETVMFHHNSSQSSCHTNVLGVKVYEFSCSSSPANPGFHFRKRRNYFPSLGIPCMHPQQKQEEEMEELNSARWHADLSKEYTTRGSLEAYEFPCVGGSSSSRREFNIYVEEDWRTAYSSSRFTSSRWSIPEEEEGQEYGYEVDKQAEEFIAKFYNEIQLQREFSFSQYKEMLSRGS